MAGANVYQIITDKANHLGRENVLTIYFEAVTKPTNTNTIGRNLKAN